MDNYISCNFMGGLGNQLFQASHALAQGWRHNRETIFTLKQYIPMQGRCTMYYRDNIFNNLKFIDELNNATIINEISWDYNEINPADNSTIFQGYFQSSKNFLGYDEKIKNIFSPTEDFIKKIYEKYPQLNQDNTLSIHVRFGDYKLNPSIHPVISKEYLDRSLNIIGKYSHLFLFSDDKNWLFSNFNGENITIIDEEDYVDMWIMSLCKNNIISNSSFSWWSAFLNKNKNKKVICPSIWFGSNGPKNYSDTYEPEWLKLDVINVNGELK